MNKIKTIAIIAASALLFGCGTASNEKSTVQTDTVAVEEHHHENETEAIVLDNGAKWKVNDEMMIHIRTMEKDVDAFAGSPQKDFNSLTGNLQKNIDLLTSSCTMKGKSHEELHKWLLPHIKVVTALSEAKDDAEKAKQFENIQTSLATFNQYFE